MNYQCIQMQVHKISFTENLFIIQFQNKKNHEGFLPGLVNNISFCVHISHDLVFLLHFHVYFTFNRIKES